MHREQPETSNQQRISEGIALFNSARFWHAHEAWERIWLGSTGEDKLFLQGLIQLAAAYHHVSRGTFPGGVRLFDAALEKLMRFPGNHLGIDRAEAVASAARHREKISRGENIDASEYPKLRFE